MAEIKPYRNRIRLDNPLAVQRLLARTINLLIDNEISDSRAKTIGYVANILIQSFETVNFDKRLEQLENTLIRDEEAGA